MMKEKNKFQLIGSEAICEIYQLLHSQSLISFPITSDAKNRLDSLVSSINSSYFDNELYATDEEKAIAYLYFIIKNHPFTDGNKRTACLTFEVVCSFVGLAPNYKDTSLDEIAVFIEKNKTDDHQLFIKELANFIFA